MTKTPHLSTAEDSMNFVNEKSFKEIQTKNLQGYFSQGKTSYFHILVNQAICDSEGCFIIAKEFLKLLNGENIEFHEPVSLPELINFDIGEQIDFPYTFNVVKYLFKHQPSNKNQLEFFIAEFSKEETVLLEKFCDENNTQLHIFCQLSSIMCKLFLDKTTHWKYGLCFQENINAIQRISAISENIIMQIERSDLEGDFIKVAQEVSEQYLSLKKDNFDKHINIQRNIVYSGAKLEQDSFCSDFTNYFGDIELNCLNHKIGKVNKEKYVNIESQLFCAKSQGQLYGVFCNSQQMTESQQVCDSWKRFILRVII
ncbi:hypothetical protein SS50377_26610 [Spironucleus salmonicida]|nr:hypothetical protein SS50377_26610 [Spironucleus salmonicida]